MRTAKIVAASVLMAGVLQSCTPRSEAQTPPAPAVTVAVPLVRQVQDWDEFTGRFEATRSVEVRARVGGYISAVHFRDGAQVRQGQLLFTLDPRPAQAALAAARASLAQAQAQLALARTNLARSEGLLEAQAVSRAEVDAQRGAQQTAEASVAAANAAVRARQLDLEFTRVTAPISGRVSDRRIDPGNLVGGGSSGADVLTTIVAGGPVYFTFDASEAVLLKYQRQTRQGTAPVRLRLQDEAGFSRSGTLDFTDNAVDTASGVIRLVPDAAITTDQARRIVYVVAADGSVAPRPVQTGPLVEGLRVVRSGLQRTDRVVINGVQRIQQPGMKVQASAGRIEPVAGRSDLPVTQAAPASSATFAASLSSGD